MPAERKRGLEAVAADAAAERADIGAGLDEAVVHGADAVGATDLPARPIAGLLLGRSGPRRRGGGTFSLRLRRRFVRLGGIENGKRRQQCNARN